MKRILTAGMVMIVWAAVAACGERPDQREAPERAVPSAADAAVAAPANGEERRVVYVDVRQPDEWADGHVEGAVLIPHTEMATRWRELEEHRDADIVLYCRTGRRSGIAEEVLRQAGFEHLTNGGGLSELERRGVPVVPCATC